MGLLRSAAGLAARRSGTRRNSSGSPRPMPASPDPAERTTRLPSGSGSQLERRGTSSRRPGGGACCFPKTPERGAPSDAFPSVGNEYSRRRRRPRKSQSQSLSNGISSDASGRTRRGYPLRPALSAQPRTITDAWRCMTRKGSEVRVLYGPPETVQIDGGSCSRLRSEGTDGAAANGPLNLLTNSASRWGEEKACGQPGV